MATFDFNTITPAQAAAFNPAEDTLTFAGFSASALTVTLGAATTTLSLGGRNVVLGTTPNATVPLESDNFDFADNSILFLGVTGADNQTVSVNGSAYYGGDGVDTFTVTTATTNVLVQGNQGEDIITFEGTATGRAFGGAGSDEITLSGSGAVAVNGNLGDDTITVDGDGNNTIQGGGDDDTITINGDGNNLVFGDLGDDTVEIVGLGNNTVNGGDGIDTITISGTGNNVVNGNAGEDAITVDAGATGSNLVQGGAGDDTIIVGVIGTDDTVLRVFGDAGDDVIDGTGSDATLGSITLNGGAGDDAIIGGGGGQLLQGGQGNDTILAGGGGDTISGDLGTDTVIGGAGDDLFLFTSAGSSVADGGDLVALFDDAGDSISFGAAGGNGVNYREFAFNAASFDEAEAFANNQIGNGVSYVLVDVGTSSSVDFGVAGSAGSLLFADLDGDSVADTVIRLSGVGLDDFAAGNIVA